MENLNHHKSFEIFFQRKKMALLEDALKRDSTVFSNDDISFKTFCNKQLSSVIKQFHGKITEWFTKGKCTNYENLIQN